jgi:two-component system, NtrC family, nitrogen regulation response regulator NtrX
MRILVVDDEIVVADLLADTVRRLGHEARAVIDARDGLAVLRQHGADAVFLDVSMPGMTGIEFLRDLRRTHPTVPVILVTGQATPAEVDEARRLGVIDVIEKPHIIKHLYDIFAALAPSEPNPPRHP